MTEDKNKLMHISTSWPTVVSDNVVFKCLEQYHVNSIWKQPVVCCVCGLLRQKIDLIDVSDGYCYDFEQYHVLLTVVVLVLLSPINRICCWVSQQVNMIVRVVLIVLMRR